VEQQLARAIGLVVGVSAAFVRRDVEVEEVGLAVLDDAVGVGDVGASVAEGFDLGAGKDEPRLKCFEDVVVETRALVARDRDDLIRFIGGGLLGHGAAT
jgi:hypothetical protein